MQSLARFGASLRNATATATARMLRLSRAVAAACRPLQRIA